MLGQKHRGQARQVPSSDAWNAERTLGGKNTFAVFGATRDATSSGQNIEKQTCFPRLE